MALSTEEKKFLRKAIADNVFGSVENGVEFVLENVSQMSDFDIQTALSAYRDTLIQQRTQLIARTTQQSSRAQAELDELQELVIGA